MKIFRKEKGKEVVYVQGKDLALITNIEYLSRNFDTNISLSSIISSNAEKFTRIDNENAVEMLKNIYFIVNFDEIKKLTEEEIYEKLRENRLEMDKLIVSIKRTKKSEVKPLRDAYITRENYSQDLLMCLECKKKHRTLKHIMFV